MFFVRSPLGIPAVRNMRCHVRAAGSAGVQLSGVRGDICICGARWGPWGSRCWGYVVSFAFEFWNVICIWRSSRRTRRRGMEEGNIQALQSWRRENVIQGWCFTICYFHVAYVAYVTFSVANKRVLNWITMFLRSLSFMHSPPPAPINFNKYFRISLSIFVRLSDYGTRLWNSGISSGWKFNTPFDAPLPQFHKLAHF